jgi:phosphoribosylaminoimidazole (AIR) synthetase
VLGLPSSGVHSNGFSLVRKVLEVAGVSLHDPAPWAAGGAGARPAGLDLLEPTVIYVKRVLELHDKVRALWLRWWRCGRCVWGWWCVCVGGGRGVCV